METNYLKLTKGMLLVLWMVCLITAFVYVLRSSVSAIFVDSFLTSNPPSISIENDEEDGEILPLKELKNYLAVENAKPLPIESVLEKYIVPAHWTEVDIKNGNQSIENISAWKKEQYRRLFERIRTALLRFAEEESFNPGQDPVEVNVMITRRFIVSSNSDSANEMLLPPQAVTWVLSERARLDSLKAKISLIDTIALLLALGALGALIFLTKNYVSRETNLPVEEYIFRPILGMFLAISVFVVIASADAIVSDSGLENLRKGPLLLLAFSAGLMSEQVYEYLKKKAAGAMKK